MKFKSTRRNFLFLLSSALAWLATPAFAQTSDIPLPRKDGHGGPGGGRGGGQETGPGHRGETQDFELPAEFSAFALLSCVLGRASDRSITVSTLTKENIEGYFEYGTTSGIYTNKTALLNFTADKPLEAVFDTLLPDTSYFYRLLYRKPGHTEFKNRPECRFHTQRSPGSSFMFAIQGDSHPERPQMSNPELYARTLQSVAASQPDFYICIGDDFSVDTLHNANAETVAQRYTLQRPFLGMVAQSSPLFLVNGNHEQAALVNLNDTPDNIAVWAQNARNSYFPTVAPDGFYTGNTEPVKFIGPLKDYYAWTWGDALFVVIDFYWHSPVQVDNPFQGNAKPHAEGKPKGPGNRDLWGITLGDTQYQWFKQTLEQSKAKYKFVFTHHVLGTTRGGIENSELFEWGGKGRQGEWEFPRHRPGWELPIHQLMVKNGVTIFFQGHDHIYVRQERDGLIYQELPMPADHSYTAQNENSYLSGVKFPSSGHLRVTVAREGVKVDYIRSFLAKDESATARHGTIAYSYEVKPWSVPAT